MQVQVQVRAQAQAQAGRDVVAVSPTLEHQLKHMSISDLQHVLRLQGLSPSGRKAELVGHALTGVPVVVIPPPGPCTYEYDPKPKRAISGVYGAVRGAGGAF